MSKEKISLSHGSGGRLMHELVKELFLRKFDNPILSKLTDAAILEARDKRLAFTTDSYVVRPLFFPGGDIGKLAICGTVNDLSVVGARPLFISCGLIIEEGLDYSTLELIAESMREAAELARVKVVTGDLKVVEKGSADKLFINTSGIGGIDDGIQLSTKRIEAGDRIIINGPIASHGVSVLSSREGFDFESRIESDLAPLNDLISTALCASDQIKFMRDPTRGGLATTLNEMASASEFGIMIEETDIPVDDDVKGVCELLGFDPLYIGNEGKVVIVVGPEDVEKVCECMRAHELGRNAQIIGEVVAGPKQKVCMKTLIGGTRIVDMLVGDQLPRIC